MPHCSSPAPLPADVGPGGKLGMHEASGDELAPERLKKVLEVLTGDPSPGDIRHGGGLLYLFSNRAEFARQMPLFDEWGLRPAGLTGPRENPITVAPFPAASTDLAPGVGAGRQASLETGGLGVVAMMPHGVPEASSFGACEARPEAVVDGGRNLQLPRLEPPRPRQAIRRWCLIAPSILAPLKLAAWMLLHPLHALV